MRRRGETRVLVTGGGGFIGAHFVRFPKEQGHWVRGVDAKEPKCGQRDAGEFAVVDLRRAEVAQPAVRGVDEVYALAADMGGMACVSVHNVDILENNSLIDINTPQAARNNGVSRLREARLGPQVIRRDCVNGWCSAR